MTLGERIKELREARGWTLLQLATASDVDVGTISALEVRKSTRSKFAAQLAAALGVSMEELLSASSGSPPKGVGVSYLRGGATRVMAGESPASSWPFTSITRKEWASLDAAERAEVQGFIRGLLRGKRHVV